MEKRMIKLTGALLLVASLVFSGCGKSTQLDDYATNEGSDSVEEGTEAVADNTSGDTGGIPKDEIKVGVIHLSDPAEGSGYTYTHDLGIQGMQQNLNLSDDQIVRKINISDTDADATRAAIQECIDEGCNIYFHHKLGLYGDHRRDGRRISGYLFFPWNRIYEQWKEFQ